MGFIKGVPYEFPASNQNPVGVMDRFWEAHDFIIKAMTSHDEPFNWEGEYFHYRQVNIWPRPVQQPPPPIWTTTGNRNQARDQCVFYCCDAIYHYLNLMPLRTHLTVPRLTRITLDGFADIYFILRKQHL